mmetsp:Transcript_44273/g.115124  ORF Transcript_44273/g.115124 Transcript_44273/m.115124 type:complete len:237 (+) Transcript_44273:205-915(+)
MREEHEEEAEDKKRGRGRRRGLRRPPEVPEGLGKRPGGPKKAGRRPGTSMPEARSSSGDHGEARRGRRSLRRALDALLGGEVLVPLLVGGLQLLLVHLAHGLWHLVLVARRRHLLLVGRDGAVQALQLLLHPGQLLREVEPGHLDENEALLVHHRLQRALRRGRASVDRLHLSDEGHAPEAFREALQNLQHLGLGVPHEASGARPRRQPQGGLLRPELFGDLAEHLHLLLHRAVVP